MQTFDGIEHETGENPDLSVIWLHGLGADASDFLPIVGELALPSATRFVFPNAPQRSVTINGGMRMRAWFDLVPNGAGIVENLDHLFASVGTVRELAAREIGRGIAVDRVLLAGFSQGGATVLHAGLGGAEPLGGLLALSTWLPAADRLTVVDDAVRGMPVLMTHGTADPIIPLYSAERSAAHIQALGVDVEFRRYPMGHEVCIDEIRDISAWLRRFASR